MSPAAKLAIDTARGLTDPERQIVDCMWIPFALLYDELVKAGTPKLSELPESKKLEYWNKTKGAVRGGIPLQTKRIMIAEALYVYHLITQDENLQTV